MVTLTGKREEWDENLHQNARHSDKFFHQNKLDPEVFLEPGKSQAWWIAGRIFRAKNGLTFTARESWVKISFPWDKPEPEIIVEQPDYENIL